MALNIQNIYDALRTLLVSIDSNLTNNVWEAEQSAAFPWTDRTLPMATIALHEIQESEDWGITNQSFEIAAEIKYACETDGPATTLRTKLEAIYDALISISYAPTGFQVLDVDAIDYSRNVEPNQAWIEKGATQRAGMVRAKLLIGETQVP